MIRSLLPGILILMVLHVFPPMEPHAESYAGEIADLGMAKDYCDRSLLDDVEGIWHYVEDDVKVLIRKSRLSDGNYDMIVVETPDCRLKPGDVIGRLLTSTDASRFRMQVFTAHKGGILTDSRECLAVMTKEKDALRIQPRKVRISLRSFGILPRFWRMLKVSVDDPTAELPKGVVKIYPAYDGDGSSRRSPRYL